MGTRGVHLLLPSSCNRYYTLLITCPTGYNRFCSQMRKYVSTAHTIFFFDFGTNLLNGVLEKRAQLKLTVVVSTTILKLYTQPFPISSVTQIAKISWSIYLRPFFQVKTWYIPPSNFSKFCLSVYSFVCFYKQKDKAAHTLLCSLASLSTLWVLITFYDPRSCFCDYLEHRMKNGS